MKSMKGVYMLVLLKNNSVEPRYTLCDASGKVMCVSSEPLTLNSPSTADFLDFLDMLKEGATLPVISISDVLLMHPDVMFDMEDEVHHDEAA